MADLESEHLARLHELAAERGIEDYRLLRRDELIELLAGPQTSGPQADEPKAAEPQTAEPKDAESETAPQEAVKVPAAEEGTVAGVLDVLPAGHGFLRLDGLEPGPDDVYISASQIRRCELRAGDSVQGPARPPRRGEHHPALTRVELVNGAEAMGEREQGFDELTPVTPHRRIQLQAAPDDVLVRAVDLLVPLAYGQRVLVIAEPRSGRTTLLRGLVEAIDGAEGAPGIIVLLVDERPEEVTAWRRGAATAEIVAAPADLSAEDQVRHSELAVARAKRRAEAGEDVVMIVDSLTRLGVAHRDPGAVKPVFGAGRELEEERGGSLTMIATVLRGTEDGEAALEAVETTENAMIVLDPELAAHGVVPAIDMARSRVVAEDALRDPAELEAAGRLREELRDADTRAAALALAERIRSSASNAELLSSL